MTLLTLARLWAKVTESAHAHSGLPCWLWTAAPGPDGYGRFRYGRRKVSAHRLVYEIMIGPIPPGLQLDHLCRTRLCVNPWHLDPVTPKVNTARGQLITRQLMKTQCPAGHAYTGPNLYITPSGARACKICRATQDRAHRASKQAPK